MSRSCFLRGKQITGEYFIKSFCYYKSSSRIAKGISSEMICSPDNVALAETKRGRGVIKIVSVLNRAFWLCSRTCCWPRCADTWPWPVCRNTICTRPRRITSSTRWTTRRRATSSGSGKRATDAATSRARTACWSRTVRPAWSSTPRTASTGSTRASRKSRRLPVTSVVRTATSTAEAAVVTGGAPSCARATRYWPFTRTTGVAGLAFFRVNSST